MRRVFTTTLTFLLFCLVSFSMVHAELNQLGAERVLFSANWEPGTEIDIFSMNPDGSDLKNLTVDYDANAVAPAVSPDGKRVAFRGYLTGTKEVWVMNIDGSGKTQVTSKSAGNWGVGAPTWFDDDTLIYNYAYNGDPGGYSKIYTIDIDGGNDGVFIDMNGQGFEDISTEGYCTLSPAGTMVVFVAQTGSWSPTLDVYVADVIDAHSVTNIQKVSTGWSDNYKDEKAVWAPDGSGIYWCHATETGYGTLPTQVLFYDLITGGEPVEIIPDTDVELSLFDISPNGETLVYMETGSDELLGWDIPASLPSILYKGANGYSGAAWDFLRMERVIFAARWVAGSEIDIYSIHPDGSGLKNLTADYDADAVAPAISPDGSMIAFRGFLSGNKELWVMNADGSNKTQVTSKSAGNWGVGAPTWFDDDTLIYNYAYNGDPGGYTKIYTIDIDGGNDGVFIDMNEFGFPDISTEGYCSLCPDGSKVVFVAQGGSWSPTLDVYIADVVDAHNVTQVQCVSDEWPDDYKDEKAVWAMDGSGVYWCHATQTGFGTLPTEILFRDVNLVDPAEVIVPDNGTELTLDAISPDGDTLCYVETFENKLFGWNIPLATQNTIFEGAYKYYGWDWGFCFQHPGVLEASSYLFPLDTGAECDLYLQAGPESANLKYLVLGGVTGTSPGYPLTGGAALPINWDLFTDIVVLNLNTPFFENFMGTLDSMGCVNPHLNIPRALDPSLAGLKAYFAATWKELGTFEASNPICLDLIP